MARAAPWRGFALCILISYQETTKLLDNYTNSLDVYTRGIDASGKLLANKIVDLPRGPGRPPGQNKTGGRKPGSKNRVRETVEAVGRLINGGPGEVSQAELAKALKLDRSATSRRVATAINRGYVKNLEERKGRPARLVVGDPMHDEIDILPKPQDLSAAPLHCCSVDAGDTAPMPAAMRSLPGHAAL